MFSSLVRFHAIGERRRVGDELRVRLEHGVDDAQAVGAQRRSGFGDFDDGVGQTRRLDLGRAPRELDVDVDAVPREVRLRRAHQLGGDRRALEIRARSDSASPPARPAPSAPCRSSASRRSDRPAASTPASPPFAAACSAIQSWPVRPGVEHAVRDVARHLLRANQHAVDLRIVDGREVRPRARVDVESRAREELDRRVLQRALRECRVSECWHCVESSEHC